MKKFLICSTNACMERMFDCQKISNYLVINGWHSIQKASRADLIIINTCSFNEEEDNSSIDYVRYYLKKKKKSAKIFIAGCISKINPSRINQVGDFSFIAPTDLHKLDALLKTEVRFCDVSEPNNIRASDILYKPIFKKLLAVESVLKKFFRQFSFKKIFFKQCVRAIRRITEFMLFMKCYINPLLVGNRDKFFYLRISKGCLSYCAYCGKRFSTGTLNSKPLNEILNEFRGGLRGGYNNFFLLSEDSGCYGMDSGVTIGQLLKELFAVGKGYDYKLAISNLNAQWFLKYYDELKDIIVKNQENILYIQIPVQSGSNRIIGLMKRNYTINEVENCLLALKNSAPSLNFTTDIIVGFPGETEDEFRMTQSFMAKVKFCYVDVFSYADRPNTAASKMDNKVPPEIINRRVSDLLKIHDLGFRDIRLVKKFIELTRSII